MSAHSGPSLLGNGGEWILNIIKRNPEGLLLLAAGAVLMMRTGGSQSPPDASRDAGHTRGGAESASKVAETVTDTLNRTVGVANPLTLPAYLTLPTKQWMPRNLMLLQRPTMPTKRDARRANSQTGWSEQHGIGRKPSSKISPLPL